MVKFVDLKRLHSSLVSSFTKTLRRHILNSNFVLGESVQRFEKNFSSYLGVKYAVGVNSGTDALMISLKSLGLEKGEEVIVPAFTFVSTASSVVLMGGRPVFCDIEEDTLGMDVEDLKKKITSKTKAVICVHLYGNPCNILEIKRICRKNKIFLIEDACQAHGAKVKFRGSFKFVGTFGDCGCFSFYPSKNLGALADGGMLVSSKKSIYKKALILRDCGRISKNVFLHPGFNTRLSSIQASFLDIKLRYLDEWNRRRKKIAGWYKQLLEDVPQVKIVPEEKYGECVYHLIGILTSQRDALLEFLKSKGIEVGIHYPFPLHLQPCFKYLNYKKGDFPVSEKIASSILTLPLHPYLSYKEIRYVCYQIKKFYTSKKQ